MRVQSNCHVSPPELGSSTSHRERVTSWEEDIVEVERSRAEALAPHVQGPVLVAALVQIGGMNDLGGWLRRTIYGGERGLPGAGLIAVTPSDIYIFELTKRGEAGPELRRWPRPTLRATKVKRFGVAARLFLTLESGKRAILVLRGDGTSSAVRERVCRLFGEATEEVPAPDRSGSSSEPAMVSQSEEFSRSSADMLARAYPVVDSDETIRFRLTEMAPAPLILGPLLLLYGFFWPLFRLARGSRALVLTDQNLYVIRGGEVDATVLYKKPVESARVQPGGSIALGRYLKIGEHKFWMLGPPKEISDQLAAASSR